MEFETTHGFKIKIPSMKTGIRKNNLKDILTERGSSTTWLHKKLKDKEIYVCYETVKRWVRDEHLPNNDRTILAICEILGVDLFELEKV